MKLPILATLLLAANAPAQYTFTSVEDTNGPNTAYNGYAPAINASGSVAYNALRDTTFLPVIMRWNPGGSPVPAADTSGPLKGMADPTINDAGLVVFGSTNDEENTTIPYFSQNVSAHPAAGPLGVVDGTTHDSTPGAVNLDEFTNVSGRPMSAAGTDHVAYYCRISLRDPANSNQKRRRVFINTAGTRTLLLDDATLPGFKTASADFQFGGANASGQVAVKCKMLDNFNTGIFILRAGQPVQTVITTAAPVAFTTYSSLSIWRINDAGQVLFSASFFYNEPGQPTQSSSGLYLGTPGSPPVKIIPGSFGFMDPVSMAPNGKLAIKANNALWSGGNAATDKIIGNGDTLFGSTVSSLTIQNHAVNNSGQVAFYYQLGDGRRGIAVATPPPSALPELLHSVTGNTLNLSWATDATVALRTSTDLAIWTPVPGPFTSAGGFTLWSGPMSGRGFYRLTRP